MVNKQQPKEYAAALGRQGGKARAKALSPEERRESARRAVQARWSKQKKRDVTGETNAATQKTIRVHLPAHQESQVTDRSRELMSRLLDKRLPKGSPQRQAFDILCAARCDRSVLGGFTTLIMFISTLPKQKVTDLARIPKSEMKSVPEDLIRLADRIDDLNRDKIVGVLAYLRAKSDGDASLPEGVRADLRKRANLYLELPRLMRLYAEGAYAPKWYQRRITRQVHELAQEYGIGPSHTGMPRRISEPEPTRPPLPEPTQLSLI